MLKLKSPVVTQPPAKFSSDRAETKLMGIENGILQHNGSRYFFLESLHERKKEKKKKKR